jgi:hypothetical protein
LTASAPIKRARELLAEAGLRPLTPPVTVAGIPFDFSVILIADDSLDLVVLVDTVEDGPEEEARREIGGLARALDVAGSRRPLTVALIGPRWSELTERAMARVARVLVCEVVLDDDAMAALHDALAVLLPLTLTTAPQEPTESWANVRAQLQKGAGGPDLADLLGAAPRGAGRVRNALVRFLAEPVERDADA